MLAVGKFAVSYLRVSTLEQGRRGGTEEGFSIPAQREVNARTAESLGATIVQEFVDLGVSGTSTDRPGLRQMLDFVRGCQIDYVIVHKVDRLARNRADDGDITRSLARLGTTVVSSTEGIDPTPSGQLVHGIMASIAEFYSHNLGAEVMKGMSQKARAGGTAGLAPIGYCNVGVTDAQGRFSRGVEIDPVRAPMVRWAFQHYAQGHATLVSLAESLKILGLTAVPRPGQDVRPFGASSVHRMLRNPYYMGIVRFRGVEYPGTHEPLVDRTTWGRVQEILASHQSSRSQGARHPHHLTGMIRCGQCQSRLVVSNARSKSGRIYPYFVCGGRASKRVDCTQKAVLISTVERAVDDLYARISITPSQREVLEALWRQRAVHAGATKQMMRTLGKRREQIEAEQDKLMQAYYADAIPLPVLQREQMRLRQTLTQLDRELDAADAASSESVDGELAVLELLEDAVGTYRAADGPAKRNLHEALFESIAINHDASAVDEVPSIPHDRIKQIAARTVGACNGSRKARLRNGLLGNPPILL